MAVKNFIVGQVISSLKSSFCLVKHLVDFMHREGFQLLIFHSLGTLSQLCGQPQHIFRSQRAIKIIAKA